jgi:hypothetical protein
MLLTPADGSFRLELMDIDVMLRLLLLLLLMLDGIKPWPMSGSAAVAKGNEVVRAKTTTNKMVAMATDVEVEADSNTFNRGMKTVSSSTCEPIRKKENKTKELIGFRKTNSFSSSPSVVSSYKNKRRRRMSGTTTTTTTKIKRNKNKGAISCMRNETQ